MPKTFVNFSAKTITTKTPEPETALVPPTPELPNTVKTQPTNGNNHIQQKKPPEKMTYEKMISVGNDKVLPDWMFWIPTTQRPAWRGQLGSLERSTTISTNVNPTMAATDRPKTMPETATIISTISQKVLPVAVNSQERYLPRPTTDIARNAWIDPLLMQKFQGAALQFLARRKLESIQGSTSTFPPTTEKAIQNLRKVPYNMVANPEWLGLLNPLLQTKSGLVEQESDEVTMTNTKATKTAVPVTHTTEVLIPVKISTSLKNETVPTTTPYYTVPTAPSTHPPAQRNTVPDSTVLGTTTQLTSLSPSLDGYIRVQTLRELLQDFMKRRNQVATSASPEIDEFSEITPNSQVFTSPGNDELSDITPTLQVSTGSPQQKSTVETESVSTKASQTLSTVRNDEENHFQTGIPDAKNIRFQIRNKTDLTLRTRLLIITAATVEPPRTQFSTLPTNPAFSTQDSTPRTTTGPSFTLREGFDSASFRADLTKLIRLLNAGKGYQEG